MLILHASWCDSKLLLWSETDRAAVGAGRTRRTAGSPWDGGWTALVEAVRRFGNGGKAARSSKLEAVAWLPSGEEAPFPSSALLGARAPASEEDLEIIPWVVTALAPGVEILEHLMAECAARRQNGTNLLAPGFVIGDDLAFWTEATRFVYSLVARQQFIPALVEVEGGGYEARWKAALIGLDARRILELAAAMPPSARALTSSDEDGQPDRPARIVLADYCDRLVDHRVRHSAMQPAHGKPESLHDRWLAALTSPLAGVEGDPAKLRALAGHLRDWERPIRTEASAPYRLCFRLNEPVQESGAVSESWRVEYLLQGASDPTLLLPAATVWGVHRAAAKIAPAAREHLLISLGQAAGIAPRVEASLKQRDPEGFTMDVGGAHEFLSSTAPALEQSGFAVLLPAWWTGRGAAQRLSARASVKSPPMVASAGLTLSAIVEFDWQVAIGDTALTLSELQALAKLKAPLVRIRGQWVEVNGAQIQAAVEFLRKKSAGTATVDEVVRMALGAGGVAGPLDVAGVEATGWVGALLGQLQGTRPFAEIAPPDGLAATLRHYQQRGYSWLDFLTQTGLGACLADDMGLGKTIQTLALVQRRVETGRAAGRPTLLVCPMSVVGNWVKEASRFVPDLDVMVHHGVERAKGQRFAEEAGLHQMVISSYALLHRDFDILKTVGWDGVVLDEAQNIKNPETRQAKAAREIQAGFRVALTGTPVENNVGDLWSLFEFLNPGLLGGRTDFRRKFFIPIQMNRDPVAADRLKKLTGPLILRRLKTDKAIISDLPDKLEMKVFCNLTKEQVSLYTAVVKEAEDALNGATGIQRKGLVLATLAKLKQVCNHPAHFAKESAGTLEGRSGKLARLSEMLEEVVAVGDRALIFTQFSEMGELLKRHLQESYGREVLFLHGGVSKKQRDAMVERFCEANGPPLFVLSLKAGGTGLNLINASHVFHFDRWWNPAVENQATDRAFRIGQTRNVQVHKFVCAGTLEEKIDGMIEQKKDLAGRVVGTGEGWLTELSNTELRSLFALSKEALGD